MAKKDFFDDDEEIEISSEEAPMEEWSSLILPNLPIDRRISGEINSEDVTAVESGEICTKYISMSDSAVLRHPYYNYPAVIDPGIRRALLEPDEKKRYSDDGQELYIDLCKEMHTCIVKRFQKELLEERVNLGYYGLNPVGIRPMAMALCRNRTVKVLDLTDNFLSYDACYHLGRMIEENFTLVELNMTGCRIGAEGARLLFSGLPANRSIKILNVSRNDLGDTGAQYMAQAINGRAGFQHLNLSYNSMNLKSALVLAEALDYNNKLITLDLSWNSLYPQEGIIELLKPLSQSEFLKELYLSWNSLAGSEEFGESLKALFFAPELRVLDLSNNRLNDEAITPIIPALSKAPNLEILNLSFNLISSTKAQKILERFANPAVAIRQLYLDNIIVTEEFVNKREEILQLPFREGTIITHGDVTKPMVFKVDPRDVVLNRLEFLCKKNKKAPLDIALFVQGLLKTLNRPLISRELGKLAIKSGAKIDGELCDAVAQRFPGPPGKFETIDLEIMVDYMKRKWPERQLPPTPPPEPEPEVKEEDKGKKKKKNQKSK